SLQRLLLALHEGSAVFRFKYRELGLCNQRVFFPGGAAEHAETGIGFELATRLDAQVCTWRQSGPHGFKPTCAKQEADFYWLGPLSCLESCPRRNRLGHVFHNHPGGENSVLKKWGVVPDANSRHGVIVIGVQQ